MHQCEFFEDIVLLNNVTIKGVKCQDRVYQGDASVDHDLGAIKNVIAIKIIIILNSDCGIKYSTRPEMRSKR